MLISDIAKELESWAPPAVAESYDNVGLLVGIPSAEVTGVMVNLDMTEEVIDEAIEKGCNMVVAHHPIWFTGRKRLNGEDYVSRAIMKAVKNDVALYAIHTNLDNIRSGVNRVISDRLGLQYLSFLKAKDEEGNIGSGMIGMLPDALTKEEFLVLASEKWEEIEKKKSSSATFYDYEKGFDELWVEFGRRSLEGSLGKKNSDRRKKKKPESLRGNRDE